MNRSVSDSWKGFTKFILLKEKPPKRYIWSGEGLTKIQATTRPENVWPEVWSKIGQATQKREKQDWAKEKPKLDGARRLRGIYFIDQEDEKVESKRSLIRMRKQQWTRNGRSSKRFQPGSWTKLRANRMLFRKHKETKRKSTLLHFWWTSVISKKRSENQHFQTLKVELYSEVTL